jgi:uncharacterized protein
MGHRNSSAQCHDAGCVCLDGGGARGDAARPAPLNAAATGMTAAKTDERFFASLGVTTPSPSVTGRAISHQMTAPKSQSDERLLGRQGGIGITTVSMRGLRKAADGVSPRGAGLTFDARAFARAGAGLLLFGIRFYQAIFAHLMPIGCKFYPSCSRYAAEAIERHGAARGGRLALARLWRCRPFTQGGFDPVPDADEASNGAQGTANLLANDAEGGARAEVGS